MKDESVRIETVGDMESKGYRLSVHCDRQTPPCYHMAHIDLLWLVQKVYRDYPCDAQSLARIGWRCTECGSRKVSFRMAPPTGYDALPQSDDDLPF